MTELEPIKSPTLDCLAADTFGGLGCSDFGVAVLRGATSWGAHDSGSVCVPAAATADRRERRFVIAYDEREAPFVLADLPALAGAEYEEDASCLISLSDEEGRLACAWARVEAGSALLGVGVDLASPEDFYAKPASERFVKLLFSEREHEIALGLWPSKPGLAYASLFAAKEAAFKSAAHPLRDWYRENDEELLFEVRHFSAVELGVERGEQRNAAAQRALDAMGVKRIVWRAAEVDGLALVVACVLAE